MQVPPPLASDFFPDICRMEQATLQQLLYKVPLRSITGQSPERMQQVPAAITFNSGLVVPGSVFVAVAGTQTDGHAFINAAVAAGATAVVCQVLPFQLAEGVTYIETADSHAALGRMASNFYGNPSEKLQLTGVTGTNGKTTVATLLYRLFRAMGYSTGLLSTIENRIDDEVIPSTHTTPDPVQLNALLRKMLNHGCTHAFMEVSSHALVQQRTAGLRFAGALFTNITHDHLDYNGTFDNYIKAKKLLFDNLPAEAFALVNADDKRGRIMLQNCKAASYTFSLQSPADYRARLLSDSFRGLQLELNGTEAWFRLTGKFNAYNLLTVYGTALLLHQDKEQVLTALSGLAPAPGRFEVLTSPGGITVIVDYAHTPDALDNVLGTITELRTRNETLFTVIGCGGNRDTAKRPLMAECACKYSDRVWLTSDNPRNEDPDEIINQMRKGVSPSNYRKVKVQPDRRSAIGLAIQEARPGDIVLIAGKGHENYQEVQGVKHPFSDMAVAAEFLKQ